MPVKLHVLALDKPGVETFRDKILSGDPSGQLSNPCAQALTDHVLAVGAGYAVLESPYIDKDYSADYLAFYAAAFHDYPRHTVRVHFFKTNPGPALGDGPVGDQEKALKGAGYLGFAVIRPITQGPIGRTVLPFPELGPDLVARPAARADFKVHLLGSTLEVPSAAPFIQQDERLGSCAQAAIWMAERPVHARHKSSAWQSVAEITRLATTPPDTELSRSLPAGSGGLNPIHIIRALRALGHQPLFDYFLQDKDGGAFGAASEAKADGGVKQPSGAAEQTSSGQADRFSNPRASSAIVKYLDSGLPVIVALQDVGDGVGHAVTAVGYVEARDPCRDTSGYDRFVRALIVHDDQRGPYRLMPLSEDDSAHLPKGQLLADEDRPLTVEACASHIFVPLPSRVFLRADRAETVVWDYIKDFVEKAGDGLLRDIVAETPQAEPVLKEFYDLVRSERLIRRTYLTSAGRYRHHLAKSDLDDPLKWDLIASNLPHFVWVTELISPDGPSPVADDAREVIGHMVVNATSSADPSSDLLMGHLPYFLIQRNVAPLHIERDVSPADPKAPFINEAFPLSAHRPYKGRRRRP